MKIVSSKSIALAEKKLISDSGPELAEEFMDIVGQKLAVVVQDFHNQFPHLKGTLVVGGAGNNGGDAWVCGRVLLEAGMTVRGLSSEITDSSRSLLCLKKLDQFRQQGGHVEICHKSFDFSVLPDDYVILDGLYGTGFRGELAGTDARIVQWMNRSNSPVISIDIPSGVNGNLGTPVNASNKPVRSHQNVFLGFPKIGLFLENGLNYAGQFSILDFGLRDEDLEPDDTLASLIDEQTLKQLLPKLSRCQHKYQAGYVLGYAGSPGMEGAAALSSLAAMKSGCGLVKILSPYLQSDLKTSLASEVMISEMAFQPKGFEAGEITLEDEIIKTWGQDVKKAKALYLGPGIGRTIGAEQLCHHLMKASDAPVILDADALYHFKPEWLEAKKPGSVILTPHFGELSGLLGDPGLQTMSLELMNRCREFASRHQVILLVKGCPTFIFDHEGSVPEIMAWGSPGMATAGSGDVLTGMLASLAAQGAGLKAAAVLASSFHGLAGQMAERDLGARSLIASDLIRYLPEAFRMYSGYEYREFRTKAPVEVKRLGH